jgi:hypothetical protein
VSQTKRKHGGARPGAGRPAGTPNVLPKGTVEAIRALRHRVPEGASPEVADAAGFALTRVLDVLSGRVRGADAGPVLKAAAMTREEFCGPMAQRVEASGPEGKPMVVEVRKYTDDDEENDA